MNETSFEAELAGHGRIVYPNTGRSMMPLLREHRDLMVIEKRPEGRLKKYDAVLYKRGRSYILHRILRVTEDGYVICGDNLRRLKRDITDADILGVLTAVVRGGREIRVTDAAYRLYVHLWCDLFPIRAGVIFLREQVLRIKGFLYRRIKKHI